MVTSLFSTLSQAVPTSCRRCGYKRITIMILCSVLCVSVVYLTGAIEYATSRPVSEFSWPLDLDAASIINDYKSERHRIEPINRHDFKFVLTPTVDRCQGFKLLTVLIKSKVTDAHGRAVLRRSWVDLLTRRGHRYAFIIGRCNGTNEICDSAIKEEQETYGDLLQGDFIDAYTNNTHKMTMALRYITERCSKNNASLYTLLIDNDYSLNVHNLEKYIASINKTNGLYGGQVWWTSRPFRLPLHKHYVSLETYAFSHYPPFVTAGAILLSNDIVEKFYIISLYTKYYPFDDVFYGFIARKLGIIPTSMTELLPSYFGVPGADDPANRALIATHRFGNVEEVEHIYKLFGGVNKDV